jgi:hypothetical protein
MGEKIVTPLKKSNRLMRGLEQLPGIGRTMTKYADIGGPTVHGKVIPCHRKHQNSNSGPLAALTFNTPVEV